jgi:hypothetical protein
MDKVYVLMHVHNFDDDREDVKLIGVYSSRKAAEEAINRLKDKPGFCDSPEIRDPDRIFDSGFDITEHKIDQDNWTEGYVTYTY